MIRINLLPKDMIRPEFTPRPQMALIVAFFALVTVTAFYAFTAFVFRGPQLNDEIAQQKDIQERLKPSVDRHKDLTSDISKLKSKITEIGKVTERPFELWRGLDSVWTVVQDNPKIWLDEIELLDNKKVTTEFRKLNPTTSRARGLGPQYGMKLYCFAAGESAFAMTRFRKSLREDPYLSEKFEIMNFNPEWDLNDEDDYQEAYSLSFETIIFPKVKPKVAPKTKRKPAPSPKG